MEHHQKSAYEVKHNFEFLVSNTSYNMVAMWKMYISIIQTVTAFGGRKAQPNPA